MGGSFLILGPPLKFPFQDVLCNIRFLFSAWNKFMHVCRHGLQTTVLHNLVSTFGDHDTHKPCLDPF